MFRKKLEKMMTLPFHFSAFLSLYSLLIFLPLIRPPVILSALLVSALVYFSMYFGAFLAKNRDL
jgi:hypothetical protein